MIRNIPHLEKWHRFAFRLTQYAFCCEMQLHVSRFVCFKCGYYFHFHVRRLVRGVLERAAVHASQNTIAVALGEARCDTLEPERNEPRRLVALLARNVD